MADGKNVWRCLKTDPPPVDGPGVVLFPLLCDVADVYNWSNPVFACKHGVDRGYTHWYAITPHPDQADAEARRDALE